MSSPRHTLQTAESLSSVQGKHKREVITNYLYNWWSLPAHDPQRSFQENRAHQDKICVIVSLGRDIEILKKAPIFFSPGSSYNVYASIRFRLPCSCYFVHILSKKTDHHFIGENELVHRLYAWMYTAQILNINMSHGSCRLSSTDPMRWPWLTQRR